jgi:hypothetical protein
VKEYSTTDCSGAVKSTQFFANLGCAASQTDGVGYEMATYTGASTAPPTLARSAALNTASYYMYTTYSDSNCTVLTFGVGLLMNYCLLIFDGTYSKLSYSDPSILTTTHYSNSDCSTASGYSSAITLYDSCNTLYDYHNKGFIQSSPSFISSTAGVTLR